MPATNLEPFVSESAQDGVTANAANFIYPRAMPATNLEPLQGLTGPRDVSGYVRKSLVAIPAGKKSQPHVDKIVQSFGLQNFSFILFHYDDSNWDAFPWYKSVLSLRGPPQMKWWYMKRFLTPAIAMAYEYIFPWDDDTVLSDEFDPSGFVSLLREYDIQMAQPALQGEQLVHAFEHQGAHRDVGGRFVNFIGCGVPVFSSALWNGCIWGLIYGDMASGYGHDLVWYDQCGNPRTAVIDRYFVIHNNSRHASSLPSTVYNPMREMEVMYERYHIEPGSFIDRIKDFGSFKAEDKVQKNATTISSALNGTIETSEMLLLNLYYDPLLT
eukprot:CAMPEP_0184370240 /NCGR_PEP_ID=MMETSP1089-20130417/162709_1 /TAXON_ID=38269 ORGANISM="Gloeochaete wittrockiana, Strain SAG46.84" /NCGR_SAMPLE_ID=MMETSP1089 /ASSEMBLY_ACC=CAM_ASM_000445 /LENGTH=326 /DNA_ID=CAMNT_0026712813 /DNA_START=421 /DNA_END=1401 /DNA_ORIENTATION=-